MGYAKARRARVNAFRIRSTARNGVALYEGAGIRSVEVAHFPKCATCRLCYGVRVASKEFVLVFLFFVRLAWRTAW